MPDGSQPSTGNQADTPPPSTDQDVRRQEPVPSPYEPPAEVDPVREVGNEGPGA